MPVYLSVVSSGSGLPIFSKSKGNVKNLPFSLIGSLNGVHMFAKSHSLDVLSTNTQEYKIAWKEFHESVILIGISSSCTYSTLERLLETIFDLMVLILGLDLIKAQRNIERMKRELKLCFPVINRLLDSINCSDSNNKNPSDLLGMTEAIMCPENHLIQIVLETYTECIDSLYSCILINGKISVATESWWNLHPNEIKLLVLLATTESPPKDIPVYLPHKSPTGACRLVVCVLVPNVLVCSLCSATPSLSEIENSAAHCFKNTQEILLSAVQCSPRNFPNSLQLDPGILGVLLIHKQLCKYMFSKSLQNSSKRTSSSSHRFDILKTFCYETVWNLLNQPKEGSNISSCIEKETYWCSEYHKCHAIITEENILCLLYNSSIPTYAMRLITKSTLKMLVSDKQVDW